jgi:hypothetical protein
MKKLLAYLTLLSCFMAGSTPGAANDSAITGVSGTPGNMKATQLAGEHSSVRMVRETVSMTLGQTDYVTDARFEFRNDGAATTVKMGFPESGGGGFFTENWGRQTSFKKFQTWVDGREIKATRLIASSGEEDFKAFWVKTVSFKRGQTRHVRVRYRSPLGSSVAGSFVSYGFTGGNWKGRVAQSDLSITLKAPGRYLVAAYYGETQPRQWREGDTFHFRWRDWQAQTEFSWRYLAELPGTMTRAETLKDLKVEATNIMGDENVQTLTIAATNKNFDPYRGPTFMPADFLLRDGRVFVSVRSFYENLKYDYSAGKKESASRWKGDFRWDEKTRSAIIVTGGAQQKTVRIAEGAQTFRVGDAIYKFPARTFIGGRGDHSTLYAPLASLVAALKGELKVNTKTRRVWYEIPV